MKIFFFDLRRCAAAALQLAAWLLLLWSKISLEICHECADFLWNAAGGYIFMLLFRLQSEKSEVGMTRPPP